MAGEVKPGPTPADNPGEVEDPVPFIPPEYGTTNLTLTPPSGQALFFHGEGGIFLTNRSKFMPAAPDQNHQLKKGAPLPPIGTCGAIFSLPYW